MSKFLTLLTIIVIATLFARTEPPSLTATAHASDSKAVQQPIKQKTTNEPSQPVVAPERIDVGSQCSFISGCGIIHPEGNWDGVQKWNSGGSGAYGLCQSLPASKMAAAGADWETNPVTQLKWCSTHANNYGGWQQAWEFRQCLGSCYSTYAKYNVNKDHTWW